MKRAITLLALTAGISSVGLGLGSSPSSAAISSRSSLLHGAIAQSLPASPAETWYNCLTKEVWTPAKQAWCKQVNTLKNAAYTLPEVGSVQLENGRYQNGETQVLLGNQPGAIAFGDLNQDRKTDSAALLALNMGGTATFIYLVSVMDVNGTPKVLSPVILGDRVQMKSVTIAAGKVLVDMVKHAPTDPMSNPTLAVTQTYAVQGNDLKLISEQPAASIPDAPSATACTGKFANWTVVQRFETDRYAFNLCQNGKITYLVGYAKNQTDVAIAAPAWKMGDAIVARDRGQTAYVIRWDQLTVRKNGQVVAQEPLYK